MFGDPEKTLLDLLERELNRQDESIEDIEAITVGANRHQDEPETHHVDDPEALAEWEGYTGHGLPELPNIHVWTEDRVYAKNVYDGAEGIRSVPRDPSLEDPDHLGGG